MKTSHTIDLGGNDEEIEISVSGTEIYLSACSMTGYEADVTMTLLQAEDLRDKLGSLIDFIRNELWREPGFLMNLD